MYYLVISRVNINYPNLSMRLIPSGATRLQAIRALAEYVHSMQPSYPIHQVARLLLRWQSQGFSLDWTWTEDAGYGMFYTYLAEIVEK